jgi:hypothetical protein
MNVTISNADTRNVTVMADAVIANIARSKSYPSYMKECDFTSSVAPFNFRETEGANITGNGAGMVSIFFASSDGAIGKATLSILQSRAYPRAGIYDASVPDSSGSSVETSVTFGYAEMEFSARIRTGVLSSSVTFVGAGYSFTHAGSHEVSGEDAFFQNACCFFAGSADTNWYVVHGSDYDITYFDTGISHAEWRFLTINVSEDGNTAKFYIDGNLVKTLTDPGDGSVFARENIRTCIEMRDKQATSQFASADIDYMRSACYTASR